KTSANLVVCLPPDAKLTSFGLPKREVAHTSPQMGSCRLTAHRRRPGKRMPYGLGRGFTHQAASCEWLSKKCKSHFSLTGIIPSGCSLWLRRFVERGDCHGIEGARRSRDNSDSGRRPSVPTCKT